MTQNKYTKQDFVIDRFIQNTWLFDKIFGDRWLAIYHSDREKLKLQLQQVYWYDDVFDIFPPELDIDKTDMLLKTLFTYYDQQQAQNNNTTLWNIFWN